MHILSIPANISEPIPIASGRSLQPGKQYLCPNSFIGQLFLSQWRVIINGEMWPLRSVITAKPWGQPGLPLYSSAELWLYRGGGIGDLLMITPLIRELKKRYPLIDIHVACGTAFQELFEGLDVITESIPIEHDPGSNRTVIAYEDTIEGDPAAERIHMAQMFANRLGIELLTDIRPMYIVRPEERARANAEYPRNGKKRIAVQFLASALYRSHPRMQSIVTALAKEAEVFLFGLPGQVKLSEHIPNVTNLMEDGLSIRESFAVLSTCDSCVSPDSALVHACSALDVPCLGLYGPFPSELRVTSPKAVAFNGKAPCAPCFYHATLPTDFPANMPCTKTGKCVAMENIPVDKVVEAALSL